MLHKIAFLLFLITCFASLKASENISTENSNAENWALISTDLNATKSLIRNGFFHQDGSFKNQSSSISTLTEKFSGLNTQVELIQTRQELAYKNSFTLICLVIGACILQLVAIYLTRKSPPKDSHNCNNFKASDPINHHLTSKNDNSSASTISSEATIMPTKTAYPENTLGKNGVFITKIQVEKASPLIGQKEFPLAINTMLKKSHSGNETLPLRGRAEDIRLKALEKLGKQRSISPPPTPLIPPISLRKVRDISKQKARFINQHSKLANS